MSMSTVIVDLVTKGEDPNNYNLVLVEQGPWSVHSLGEHLARLQARLYDCVDAAIDGQIAAQFPESAGANITIRLNGYDLPENKVQSFFASFASQVLELPDYASAIAASKFISGISFELDLQRLHAEDE